MGSRDWENKEVQVPEEGETWPSSLWEEALLCWHTGRKE